VVTRRIRLFIFAQALVPAVVLGWRIVDAPVPFYGWGWEMYS
jgi:hypothetical protein